MKYLGIIILDYGTAKLVKTLKVIPLFYWKKYLFTYYVMPLAW